MHCFRSFFFSLFFFIISLSENEDLLMKQRCERGILGIGFIRSHTNRKNIWSEQQQQQEINIFSEYTTISTMVLLQ